MRSLPALLTLLGLVFTLAPAAQAQAYKCKTAGGATVISSTPCGSGEKTEKSVSDSAAPAAAGDAQRDQAALDAKVAAALANGDFDLARTLALTAKHWQMIADAQRNNVQAANRSGTTASADWRAEARNSQECRDAQRNYDVDAGALGANPIKVEASKQRMYSACGIEPPATTTINVNPGVGTNRQAVLPYPFHRTTTTPGTTSTTTGSTTGTTTGNTTGHSSRSKSGLYGADPSTYRAP